MLFIDLFRKLSYYSILPQRYIDKFNPKKLELTQRKLLDHELAKLKSIFQNKGWPFGTPLVATSARFDKFCQMLEGVSEEQAQLILTLSEDFVEYDVAHIALLKVCLTKLVDQYSQSRFSDADRIFIAPIWPVDAKIDGPGHSGDALLYPTAQSLKRMPLFKEFEEKLILKRAPELIAKSIIETKIKRAFIIFVDDFSGTGSTVYNCLDYWQPIFSKDGVYCEVCAVVPVIMRVAGEAIRKHGYALFTESVHDKGITDSKRIQDKENAFLLMTGMEDLLLDIDPYRFGYAKSEALLSLMSTPDNTFPIFWYTDKVNGEIWPAPFERNRIA